AALDRDLVLLHDHGLDRSRAVLETPLLDRRAADATPTARRELDQDIVAGETRRVVDPQGSVASTRTAGACSAGSAGRHSFLACRLRAHPVRPERHVSRVGGGSRCAGAYPVSWPVWSSPCSSRVRGSPG